MLSQAVSLLLSKLGARVTISFTSPENNVSHYKVKRNTTVLEGLIKAKAPVNYSCKNGVCQSCVMQSEDAKHLPKGVQKGLSDAEKQLGHFLPCICPSDRNLKIRALNTEKAIVETEVIGAELLSQNILLLRILSPFPFKAGQFCNLYTSEGIHRSYSIASESENGVLEFHIKVVEGGAFSQWAKNTLSSGKRIKVQGPYGKCIYTKIEEGSERQLLLAGIGTGLAPLIGIIKDALTDEPEQNISLVLGAKSPDNFYFQAQLKEIVSRHPQLKIYWLSAGNTSASYTNITEGSIYEFVKTTFPNLSKHVVFLCGAESFVKKMKKICYLNDASLSNILSDVFVPNPDNQTPKEGV